MRTVAAWELAQSKTQAAMVNEVWVKLICNNLWCVILSQCVLGVEPIFWQNEKQEEDADDGPAILPMVRGFAPF
jgi:hypothetical protein